MSRVGANAPSEARADRASSPITSTKAALSALLLCLLALAVGPLPPASAHPSGAPEVARISLIDPHTVRVHWQAGAVDDYSYLAEAIGALPQGRVVDGVITPQVADPYLVEQARGLRRYVLRHIQVTHDRKRCRGVLRPVHGLAAHGFDVDFRCSGEVHRATVVISMLDDMSLYYRTVATGPGGTVKQYDAFHPSFRWSLASGRLTR